MPVHIHECRTVHAGRVFQVDVEEITLDNGVRTTMDLVRHPGAAAIVPVLQNRSVILLRQYRHAIGEILWEIPAGTRIRDEDPLVCARRELEEETGFIAGVWRYMNEITPLPGYADERIALYLATELTPSVQRLDPDEVLAVHEIPFEKALAMIHSGEIIDGKTISGLYMAARHMNWKNVP